MFQWGALTPDPSKGPTAHEQAMAEAAAAAAQVEKEKAKNRRAVRGVYMTVV